MIIYIILGVIIGLLMIVVVARSFASDSQLDATDLFGAVIIGVICGFVWPLTMVGVVLYLLCIPLVKIINRR